MSVTIKLYKTNTPNNHVTKTLTNEISLDCVYKDITSVLNPTITISTSTNLSSYNYAYISDNSRYYYITNIKHVRNNIYEIELKVDVLFSHKTEILSNKAILSRQEKIYNMYLSDNNFKIYSKKTVQTKEFPYGFNHSGTFVLTTIGGV